MKFKDIHLVIILRVDFFCYLYSIMTQALSTAFSNHSVSRPATIKSLDSKVRKRKQVTGSQLQIPSCRNTEEIVFKSTLSWFYVSSLSLCTRTVPT